RWSTDRSKNTSDTAASTRQPAREWFRARGRCPGWYRLHRRRSGWCRHTACPAAEERARRRRRRTRCRQTARSATAQRARLPAARDVDGTRWISTFEFSHSFFGGNDLRQIIRRTLDAFKMRILQAAVVIHRHLGVFALVLDQEFDRLLRLL